MNTTAIISALVALLTGFTVGHTIQGNDSSPATALINNQEMQKRFISENPLAQDFVSTRPSVNALPSEALSPEEIDGLLLMREEEKLARDVYQTLYEEWGLQIFANIAQSEQTHTEAVRDIIEKYNLSDPVTDDTIGAFTNSDMQTLYNDLTAKGSASEAEALVVGATIEDLDINDLQNLIAETDNQDIALVYENLLRGSRNHLRAFTRQLDMRGESYTPQYISEADYTDITSGTAETGMGAGGQNGGGNKERQSTRGWGGGNKGAGGRNQ